MFLVLGGYGGTMLVLDHTLGLSMNFLWHTNVWATAVMCFGASTKQGSDFFIFGELKDLDSRRFHKGNKSSDMTIDTTFTATGTGWLYFQA